MNETKQDLEETHQIDKTNTIWIYITNLYLLYLQTLYLRTVPYGTLQAWTDYKNK